jgi:serine/threonine protein kinase
MPEKMLNKANRKRFYYRIDGTIKGSFNYKYIPLRDKLERDLKNLTGSQRDSAVEFMMQCFTLDPAKRLSVTSALDSILFAHIKDACKSTKPNSKLAKAKK